MPSVYWSTLTSPSCSMLVTIIINDVFIIFIGPQPPLITGLPDEPVCPSEGSIVLNCTVYSELQTTWKINEFGVDFLFSFTGVPLGFTDSRFVGTLVSVVSVAPGLTISTLTFAANESFNGVAVECIDTSTLPYTISNITINFTLASKSMCI